MAVLKYRLYIDPVQSAHLNSVEQIDCGWTAPLPKMSHYDSATGLHHTISALSAQYWTKQDGTTAKQHRWLSLYCWEAVLSSASLSISSTCLSGTLAILWTMGLCWMIQPEKLARSSSIMMKLAGSIILVKCFRSSCSGTLFGDAVGQM